MFHRLQNFLRNRRRPMFPSTQIGDVTVQCYAQWPVDESLISRWKSLAQTVNSATAFQTPIWQAAAWSALGGRHLRLFTFHRGDQLLGVLPMHFDSQGILTTFGPGVSDYLVPLFVEQQPILDALLTVLSKHGSKSVTFCNILEHASIRSALPEIARKFGFLYQEKIVEYAPAIILPQTWDGFLDSLDSHERKELRRKMNKVQRHAAARFVRNDPNLETALKFMEACGGDKGSATHKYLRPLMQQAAPALIADGQLDLLTLYLHDEPACCLLQFRHPTGPMLYNCGYDPAMKQWSPGQVAIGLAIQNAIADGFHTYDLLRGQEAYKYRLGAVDRPLFRLTLSKP
jgi:CelD/BcsL family acetyltransferase involved in cellulose biosynthesis